MAGKILFANDAISTLAGAITNVATTAQLAAGTGILFPSPSGGDFFVLSFNDAATGLQTEIVHVTGMSGDTITSMIRGQEGTNPQAWAASDLAQSRLTAGQMQAMVQQVDYYPTRIVTTSGAFSILSASDNTIGLQRATSPGASSATLPSDAAINQTFTIQDLYGNAQAFPITINAPAGFNIAGLDAFVLNVNRGSVTFVYYGSNTYGVAA